MEINFKNIKFALILILLGTMLFVDSSSQPIWVDGLYVLLTISIAKLDSKERNKPAYLWIIAAILCSMLFLLKSIIVPFLLRF